MSFFRKKYNKARKLQDNYEGPVVLFLQAPSYHDIITKLLLLQGSLNVLYQFYKTIGYIA